MLSRLIDEIPRFFSYYNIIFLLIATWKTLSLSVLGCGFGFILGFVLVLLRMTKGWLFAPIRLLVVAYVEIFRRIPFLVMLFAVYWVTRGLGLDPSLFGIALISIVVICIAFLSEIVRAGLEGVHQTQWDTAAVMNFGRMRALRLVIIPQAWKAILPPAFSFFVMFIKDTALASQVGVLELTLASKNLNNKGFSAILVFGTCMVLYFSLSYPLNRFGGWLEARFASSRARQAERWLW